LGCLPLCMPDDGDRAGAGGPDGASRAYGGCSQELWLVRIGAGASGSRCQSVRAPGRSLSGFMASVRRNCCGARRARLPAVPRRCANLWLLPARRVCSQKLWLGLAQHPRENRFQPQVGHFDRVRLHTQAGTSIGCAPTTFANSWQRAEGALPFRLDGAATGLATRNGCATTFANNRYGSGRSPLVFPALIHNACGQRVEGNTPSDRPHSHKVCEQSVGAPEGPWDCPGEG